MTQKQKDKLLMYANNNLEKLYKQVVTPKVHEYIQLDISRVDKRIDQVKERIEEIKQIEVTE